MLKASLVVHSPYQKGEIFRQDSPLNRDDCLAFFRELKREFGAQGVVLETNDLHHPAESEIVIYNEMPKDLRAVDEKKAHVLLTESELIRPDNWDLSKHARFKKIFTWNDDFVDEKKYFKMNFTHSGSVPFLKFSEKKKFCTLIAGNKSVTHPKELYSKRIEAIRWFEENEPESFEFYGAGWKNRTHSISHSFMRRALNRFLKTTPGKIWPSYRGTLSSKLETLKQYKFSICYENAHGIPGYITEKIFESMSAGCLPVYWGASNISNYVPEACFVDKRKFENYRDLFEFLKKMDADEYNQRLEDISTYLKSDLHRQFEPAFEAKKISGDILRQGV